LKNKRGEIEGEDHTGSNDEEEYLGGEQMQ